ncbi:MAG: DNA gyrase/topoisomerase IV subunit A [Bacteroidota bacterium]
MGEHEMNGTANGQERIITLKGMYEDYFLDYASYVILERAVPAILDGLKPVQRRILHALREMDDGRYHKVANIIGQTMQFHPHGDAAIGDALVNLGQKDLLIDCQGNWGDARTGDSAAAPRYIEARLTKFALEVAFNGQTTEWQLSYDGRKKEPINLPMKFPLLLAQGGEGIAVGLSTKILPHNFIELIKASIKLLEGKNVKLYPDFASGGSIDVSDYNGGKRGGKVKVRAKIEQDGKKELVIRELPYGVTTTSLIDSILKANDKGKIKIKRVTDNTAQNVEIRVEIAPGISPEVTMDALYAFTNCEVSISPNACVIIDEKPHFLTVQDLLKVSTEHTKDLLRQELEIRKKELEEKLHFASLEKIFIEKRIYRDIEECETWDAVLDAVEIGLRKYVVTPSEKPKPSDKRLRLLRDITEDDLVRLTEIKIKRISKFNSFKADEQIAKLEEELKQVKHHLAHLTEYAIAYFQRLLDKYSKGRERRTVITTFDAIQATQVVANNAKLYVNRKEGFIGFGLKKDEFIADCSDIDDIIVFRKDGKFVVTQIADKVFVGKDITHVDVWKKGDERTTYNVAYVDGKTGRSMVKRFHVTARTRDREYDVTKGTKGSKVLYFSANPNGEAEVITVQLTQGCKAKKKIFDFDFGELAIKGRGSQGNILTRYPIRKVTLKEVGKSTLGAMKIWMDEVSGRLNTDERGRYLGAFDTGDKLLAIYKDGSYELTEIDLSLTKKYEPKEIKHIAKFKPEEAISAVYYEGNKGWTMIKRFVVETSKLDQRYNFLTDHKDSRLYFASVGTDVELQYTRRVKSEKFEESVNLTEFIDVKGWRALGNKLCEQKITSVKPIKQEQPAPSKPEKANQDASIKTGDTIDFDLNGNGQASLFDKKS